MSERRRHQARRGRAIPLDSDSDDRFLHACVPELTTTVRAANVGQMLRLLNRLMAECGDQPRMVRNCAEVLGDIVSSNPAGGVAGPATGAIIVGDIVSTAGPSAWAGRTGLVVYIDPDTDALPVWVEFRVGAAVHIDRLAVADLRRIPWP